MIEQISYYEGCGTDPYLNLAVEEQLLYEAAPGECILYLWQNRRTVVVGYNQNIWEECLTEKLNAEGGYPVRRLSGGGAVYHDLGNLNFTFLTASDNYDVEKQLLVILKAVQSLGISAIQTGRNDLVLEDARKFSGNAFYQKGERCYHHGTLMIQVDMEQLDRYLQVPDEKLRSKGIRSVRSRVANLSAYCPGLTVEQMKKELLKSFQQVYGCRVTTKKIEMLDRARLQERRDKFSSWDWIYGRTLEFTEKISGRFPWGRISLGLQIEHGIIQDAAAYSDAMEQDLIAKVPEILRGCRYEKREMAHRLNQGRDAKDSHGIFGDIGSLLNGPAG